MEDFWLLSFCCFLCAHLDVCSSAFDEFLACGLLDARACLCLALRALFGLEHLTVFVSFCFVSLSSFKYGLFMSNRMLIVVQTTSPWTILVHS